MLGRRLRRLANIGSTLGRCVVFAKKILTKIEHGNADDRVSCDHASVVAVQ